MHSFSLALQLLRRDWRSGELATLFFSLLIAVTAVLTITLVTERLTAGMGEESAELIGGNLVIDSTREPDPVWESWGQELGLRSARTYRFDSVLFLDEEMLLCSIKAVSGAYPLLGKLEVRDSPGDPSVPVDGIPAPGTAWVDARVLERLGGKVGDEIHFGAIPLKVEKILTFEPDQGNGLFQFAPRVLVNEADLEPAQVLGPGSRIRYQTMFEGENTGALKTRLEPALPVGHSLLEPGNDENRASAALLKATQYIRIATLLTIVLAAISIALTARRYSERHYDISAMLRCLGAPQKSVLKLYLYKLLLLALLATLAACVLGWFAHELVLLVLKPLLPIALPLPGLSPWLAASGSALLLTAGFALPPILRLAAMTPLRVMRRDLSPPPLSVWLVYGIAAASQGLLLFLLFDDLKDMLAILLIAAIALLLTGSGIFLALRKLKKLKTPQGLLARSIRNVAIHAATSTSQIMAFAITLMLVIVITQLRTGLLAEWRIQLPENAPNYFAFNIFPNQVDAFTRAVEAQAELKPLYPVVRGRIVGVNGDARVVEDGGDNERELNLTWTDQLPKDNTLLEGTWPPKANEVSVEQEYAERLGMKLGDRLNLDVMGETFDATVTSFRSVVWESFSPNFYLVFSREQLADMPTAYLTSFYLPEENRGLPGMLMREFPAMTMIDVNSILERMELILHQVSLSVELVMIFVLLGGFAVLFSTLQSTAAERLQEGALMRAMGASRGYMKKAYLMEFGLVGLIAGAIAVTGAEIATAVIYQRVFELAFEPSLLLWLAVPAASAIAVALAGYLGSRRILEVSPVTVLNL